MPSYDPQRWYWRATDGRVFSSASQKIMSEADPDYDAWTAAGGHATPWPRDATGLETVPMLQWVFDNAHVPVAVPEG